MILNLQKSSIKNRQSPIVITGSKSESNRLLLLQALFPTIGIQNISNADDAVLMQKALSSDSNTIDIHHAGTAMRFLTAFLSTQEGREVTLTGSSRMQERPIKVLVDALRQLGADIKYKKIEGFPPLLIHGKTITKHKVTIKANVSSQYISALLLIAPSLKNGLELILEGEITSIPYIKMTLSLLNQLGVKTKFESNTIVVEHAKSGISPITLTVESDWSSASYFYSIVALSEIGTEITLSSYKNESLQGDSVLADIYKDFGVETTFLNNSITLLKTVDCKLSTVNFQLKNAPDIAQTIAVTCLGLGINCHLEGLHTLKIKETDRLMALKIEIEKFGTPVSISEDSLTINNAQKLNDNITVETYKDHRMAMAFAPLSLKTNLTINEADVVSKSYPDFWRDLSQIGFKIKEI
ncbi:MAG: 3-phosphoshikimate 1-carboxyvinyltransferase [Flavobacteriaceae bacterium]|nr:3-phosphoshikimate 1-carboxyvinyltransferase [Flavobacteriaceae bacterium]